MHKFLKDLSFNGGVLFLAVFFIGIIIRYVGLAETSAWGDEVASWYFAQNLSNVFYTESHTPVYYFLCKLWMFVFPTSIVSLRYFSIFLSFFILLLSCFLINRKNGAKAALLVFSLWWLWPSMVIFSRQARHYSLYLDLTLLILVMWDQKQNFNKWLFWGVLAFYQLIHPLAVIPVAFLAFWDFYKIRVNKKLIFELSSAVPVTLYYLLRLLHQGQEKVHSNISWINSDSFSFFKSMLILFAGDSFPFSKFFPIEVYGFCYLIISLLLILFIKSDFRVILKNSWFLKTILIFIFTEILIEGLGLLNFNLRISRYFIYVVGFLIFSIYKFSESWSEKEKLVRCGLFSALLISYSFVFHKPWQFYFWDDQNVSRFEQEMSTLPAKETVICASAFQLDYYFQRVYQESCSEQALRLLRERKPFYFFDLNGNDKYTMIYLINSATIETYQKFDHSLLLSVSPK